MLKELQIYWRLRPFIKRLKEESMGKKLSVSVVFSIVMTCLQAVIQIGDLLPTKWKLVSVFAQIGAEALLKVQASLHNPDGSPATEPYVPLPKVE